ncbi:MAG: hypothetical protein QW469_00425 [Candidatus Aenigmatarchaeota archaeon]
MTDKAKSILYRFLRGFVAGAVATMTTITIAQAVTWKDVIDILNNLAIAGITGGISGGLLALDKYLRYEEE